MMHTPDAIGGVAQPEQDWKDDLIRSYEADGFVVVDVLAKPPERPTQRVLAYSGETHGFRIVDLPWASAEDEVVADAYVARLKELQEAHDEARTAYPTEAMLIEHPEYAENPHIIIMGR